MPALAATAQLHGYIRELPPETPDQAAARHQRVAERRKGPVIICHRGASAFAPENTLEAYAAAMDYGADGCEVDLRRTTDGVLVLFHDDMLDHLTNGFGTVDRISYPELLSLRPMFVYGAATRDTHPPTFAALLTLARQRAMLLHLDVKETGLDEQIAAMLDAADAWDHVVGINTTTAPTLAKHPKFHPVHYKGPGLFEGRKDMDPDAVRAQLASDGDAIMVDDPRLAVHELKRPQYVPVPLPEGLQKDWAPPLPMNALDRLPDVLLPAPTLKKDRKTVDGLLGVLAAGAAKERTEPDGPDDYQRERTMRIVLRAGAAEVLGEIGDRSDRVVQALEAQVAGRSLHKDWHFHGLDGAAAARALGELHATDAVPTLIAAFLRVDPALKTVVDPQFAANPLSWTDFRTKMYILPALGELHTDASREFLLLYLSMDEAKAREIAPLLYEDATRAVLKQDLTRKQIEALLKHPNTAVRGTALIECLDHPSNGRGAALKTAAPWAKDLPRARR